MKSKSVLVVAALAAFAFSPLTHAGAPEDLQALVGKVKQKLSAGQRSAEELKPELAEFDALLVKYKGEKTDEVATIAIMKAMLHLQVLEDEAAGVKMLQEVKAEFPETGPGKDVDRILESLEKSRAAREIAGKLKEGAEFPGFEAKGLDGAVVSTAALKGKVVLIDFWATWCGPCVREMPHVIQAYEKFHPQGLEIIGISLDQDRAALDAFLKENKMAWAQVFDGKGWDSELVGKYGITGIPATFLLDRDGKIAGKDLRGDELIKAIDAAVAKKTGA